MKGLILIFSLFASVQVTVAQFLAATIDQKTCLQGAHAQEGHVLQQGLNELQQMFTVTLEAVKVPPRTNGQTEEEAEQAVFPDPNVEALFIALFDQVEATQGDTRENLRRKCSFLIDLCVIVANSP